MPSRTQRRRQHQRLKEAESVPDAQRPDECGRRLCEWRREAYARAQSLTARRAWALALDPRNRALAGALDPGGELLADLERICAEAVASQAGRSLVRGSRPVADRARLVRSG